MNSIHCASSTSTITRLLVYLVIVGVSFYCLSADLLLLLSSKFLSLGVICFSFVFTLLYQDALPTVFKMVSKLLLVIPCVLYSCFVERNVSIFFLVLNGFLCYIKSDFLKKQQTPFFRTKGHRARSLNNHPRSAGLRFSSVTHNTMLPKGCFI